jgi:hypothetical protein
MSKLNKKKSFKYVIDYFEEEFNIEKKKVLEFILENQKKILFPVDLFNREITVLECIIKYLKENLDLNYKKISKLINRDPKIVGITYRRAKKKFPKKLKTDKKDLLIPVDILANRKLSPLENVVYFLVNNFNYELNQTADLIKRDSRTVWTVLDRAKKKLKNAKNS